MLVIRKSLSQLSFTAITAAFIGCTPPSVETGDPQRGGEPPIDQIVLAPVELAELLASFQRTAPSDIVYTLNEVKKSPLDYEVIQAISCAYSTCDPDNKEWSWEVLSKPLVRVNLIDVLLQAKYRGIDTIGEKTLKLDVVDMLSEPNPLVVQQCLLIFSYLDNRDDVPLIAKAAKDTTNNVTFRVAVLALTQMTSSEAANALSTIMMQANAEQRAAVADLTEGSRN